MEKFMSQKPIPSFDYGLWDGFVSEGFGTLTGTAIWYSGVELFIRHYVFHFQTYLERVQLPHEIFLCCELLFS